MSVVRFPISQSQPLAVIAIDAVILATHIVRVRRRHVRMRRSATGHTLVRLEVVLRVRDLDPHTRLLPLLPVALVLGPARPLLRDAGVQGDKFVVDPAADGVAEGVFVDLADRAGPRPAIDHVRHLLVVVGIACFAPGDQVAGEGEAGGTGLALLEGVALLLLDGNGEEGGDQGRELEKGECGIHVEDD